MSSYNMSTTSMTSPSTMRIENTTEEDPRSGKKRKISSSSSTPMLGGRKLALAEITFLPRVLIDLIGEYDRLRFPGRPVTFKMIIDNSHLDATDPKNQFGLDNQFKPLIDLRVDPHCSNNHGSKIFKTIVVNYVPDIRTTKREKRYILFVEYWAKLQSSIKKYFTSNDLHIPTLTSDCTYRSDLSFPRSFTIWTKSEAKSFLKLIGPPNNTFPGNSFEKVMNLVEKFLD